MPSANSLRQRLLICAALGFAAAHAGGAGAGPPATPIIDVDDVTRFYRLYDATGGKPSAERLQREYLDAGSAGLHQLAAQRNVTGATIAAAIAARPQAYENARACMAVLPRVKPRVAAALARFRELYPEARFPPITIAVSRTKPVGMTDGEGVRIGLEGLCATRYMNPDPEDRFVHVIAHEYAHIQQSPEPEDGRMTVLEAGLREGGAELVAELISGNVGNMAPAAIAKGHEAEIEARFMADQDKTDLSDWFYNGTNETPGDLGYWVGYRIAKAYYQRAKDKHRALRDLFELRDPKAILAASGWRPGMALQQEAGDAGAARRWSGAEKSLQKISASFTLAPA